MGYWQLTAVSPGQSRGGIRPGRKRVIASSIRAWRVRACVLRILRSLVEGSPRLSTQIPSVP
jgi:hypothetical protein